MATVDLNFCKTSTGAESPVNLDFAVDPCAPSPVVIATKSSSWDVRNPAFRSIAPVWDVLQEASSGLAVSWTTSQFAERNFLLPWDTVGPVIKSRCLSWAVSPGRAQDATLARTVTTSAALSSVNQTAALRRAGNTCEA